MSLGKSDISFAQKLYIVPFLDRIDSQLDVIDLTRIYSAIPKGGFWNVLYETLWAFAQFSIDVVTETWNLTYFVPYGPTLIVKQRHENVS